MLFRPMSLNIYIPRATVYVVLCLMLLNSCAPPSTERDRTELQELRAAYMNRYKFEFEKGGLYLNAWSLVDQEPSEDEAVTIYKAFWFEQAQKPREDTKYVYLNVFNREGNFRFQVSWDPQKNNFGFSSKAYY